MDQFKEIDAKIQKGYEYILEGDCPKGCDEWLAAWADIKELFAAGAAADILELDDKYDWTEYIFNYIQDMEMELHNAGIVDKSYFRKRIDYCRELLQWCESDDLLVENTRRAIAESYYELGDKAECDRLFVEWLDNDPDWGCGYVGRSDCYRDGKRYEMAEEILLAGYARNGLRDRIDLVDRLIELYKETGRPDKLREYEKVYSELSYNDPTDIYNSIPLKMEKVGRNDPCPCGSGKKYKKCCGA